MGEITMGVRKISKKLMGLIGSHTQEIAYLHLIIPIDTQ